jgi:cytochrome c5
MLMVASAGVLALTLLAGKAPAEPAEAPDVVAARTLVEKTCSSCHVISQVTAQRKTADQWAGTVDQMIGYGATISDADYPKIVDYLAKYHGLEAAAAKTGAH